MRILRLIKRLWNELKKEAEVVKSLKYLKERDLTALTVQTLLDESINKNIEIVIDMTTSQGNKTTMTIRPKDEKNNMKTFADRFNEAHPELI